MKEFILMVSFVVLAGFGYAYLGSHPAIMQKLMDPLPSAEATTPALPKGATFKCDHSIPAFSREGTHQQIGVFTAGSKLLIESSNDVDDMRPVCFVMEDGNHVLALCKLHDLGIKPPELAIWHVKGGEHQTVSNPAPAK